MASSFSSSLVAHFFLFSLLLFGYSYGIADGGAVERHRVIRPDSLKPRTACATPKGSNRISLVIAHRYGPCSPITNNKKPPTLPQILRHDRARVNYLQWRISRSSQGKAAAESDVGVPALLGSSLGTLEYVATVGYGTPKLDQTVTLDTGSDVSWIQCKPCPRCYPQQQPLFDRSQSSTYTALSCDSTECGKLDYRARACLNSTCIYGVGYHDNSSTIGFLSSDTLALSTADVIQSFVFGCGESNQGFSGGAAGLMGLGRGQLSLVSQASSKFGGGVFSYCLPPSPSSTGFLAFGAPQEPTSYTPMVNTGSPTFYYVQLIGISVGGQQLQIPASVFSAGGTVLDSGTIITRLQPTAYDALRSAFRSYMSSAGYQTAPPPSKLFDTCYDFSGSSSITVPKIALQFDGGATLDVDSSGILAGDCLAFAPNGKDSDTGVIGNFQQRTFEVVYDLQMKRIGFLPEACS